MNETVWTIREIMKVSKEYLQNKGVDNPRLDVELLLSRSLDIERIKLYTDFDRPLSPEERASFKSLLYRRANHEPIAYILGEAGFMGHLFNVTRDTLIPRPETEHLVEHTLALLPASGSLRILDIGTGSGCVGLSLLKLRQDLTVETWDVCENALAVATLNAERLGVQDRFFPRLASALESSSYVGEFDLIVSNPPYIASGEKADMTRGVLEYEPYRALFAEHNGLLFYEAIAANSRRILKKDGNLALEIGWKQADSVSQILSKFGYKDIKIEKDLGFRDRVVLATWQG